jgi:hypothetical protein
MAGSKLLQAITAYKRQREACEDWAAFLRAIERVEPEFYAALLKRWRLRAA